MEKINKILKRILVIGLILLVLGMATFGALLMRSIVPVDTSSNKEQTFLVNKGWGSNKIAEELEKAGLIRNATFFKIYVRLNSTDEFLAGTYKLSPSMDVESIIEILTSGKSLENETITVTFVEGKRFPYYVSKIAENFGFKEKDIYDLTSNEEFLNKLIKNYWFIGEEILNKNLYYPLEGYLFPDTYEFKKNSTIEEVIMKMLNQMGDKLNVYKEEINVSHYKIHDLLTMASMVELEAVTAEDRLILAGVFYNRLRDGWTLGSDVTTYYATKKEMTSSLTMREINDCNAYNTRGTCVKGLPVGPICSPSYSSITAAIQPETTKYYYFVADKKNELYFGVTEAEHQKNIKMLKKQNLWPE